MSIINVKLGTQNDSNTIKINLAGLKAVEFNDVDGICLLYYAGYHTPIKFDYDRRCSSSIDSDITRGIISYSEEHEKHNEYHQQEDDQGEEDVKPKHILEIAQITKKRKSKK